MNCRRAVGLVCLVLFAGCASKTVIPSSPAKRSVADTVDQVNLFFTPEDLHRTWKDKIEGARKSIFMEMFHLTDKTIVQALRKKDSSVTIQIILDSQDLLAPATKKIADSLTKGRSNITVYPSSGPPNGFTQTHTKAMIVDGADALVTSINLTTGAATTRDYGIETRDPDVIDEMTAVFNDDIQNALNAKSGTGPVKDTPRGVGQGKLVWSNVGSETRLADFIAEINEMPAGPNKFVYATVENLGDPTIAAAFSEAALNGADVRIIVPECVLGVTGARNYDYFADFKHGVQPRVMLRPASAEQPYMHGKMIVLGNGRAYVGSVNFSINSTHNNRELGIIFTNPVLTIGAAGDGSVTDAYTPNLKKTFLSDWDQAKAPGARPDCQTDATAE